MIQGIGMRWRVFLCVEESLLFVARCSTGASGEGMLSTLGSMGGMQGFNLV